MGSRDVRHSGHRLQRCDGDDDVRVFPLKHVHHIYHVKYHHTIGLEHHSVNLYSDCHSDCDDHHSSHDDRHVNRHPDCDRTNNDRDRTSVHHNQHSHGDGAAPDPDPDQHTDGDPDHDQHFDDFCRTRLGIRSDGGPAPRRTGDRLCGHETVGQNGDELENDLGEDGSVLQSGGQDDNE